MTDTKRSIAKLLRYAAQLLSVSYDSAKFEAELLLAYVLKKERSYLYTWPEYELNSQQLQYFQQLLQQRLAGQPIAYLLGQQAFWDLTLKVTTDTLIPRPETELLIETALTLYTPDQKLSILDLGTGSGAIALAMASEFKYSQILAVDISMPALHVARENVQQHRLSNVQCLQSDWFTQIPEQTFDLIISNPPYIKEYDSHLVQGDLRYEPRLALTSGNDGLRDIQHIIQHSPSYLKPHGWLMFEHGYQQATDARNYLLQAGFIHCQSLKDLAGHERISIASYC